MTSFQYAAEVQVLLEGVRLPATKDELVDYARRGDAAAADHLRRLPEREYATLDEVGEALVGVQPSATAADAPLPRAESGAPPGGDA